MIKVENIHVDGFEAAVRGMRNPLNSWAKSDSNSCINLLNDCPDNCPYKNGEDECTGPVNPFVIGPSDLDLMQRLYSAGPEHRKYLRMIHVSMDIIAPVYWDCEVDTYKIGVTRNSCSLMHKGTSRDYMLDDFSIIDPDEEDEKWIEKINKLKNKYLETKDPKYFLMMRQRIPMGYNYRFTVDMNYENVFNMIHQRENHRLPEWREFVEILKTLPYVKEIGGFSKEHSLVTNRDKLKEVFGEDNTDMIISGASDFYKWLNEEYKTSRMDTKKEALESAKHIEDLYTNAIKAMRDYSMFGKEAK